MATGVGGAGTGEGGDFVICLPGEQVITTDRGELPIGDIVNNALPVEVLTFNHATGQTQWQPIDRYENNSGAPLLEIDIGDRVIRCTEDHPIFVQGKGYTKAIELRAGDMVLRNVPIDDEREDVWWDETPYKTEATSVKSVRRIHRYELSVYNIATGNRNYFAGGVLVHNCDDPHKALEAYSQVSRERVKTWWLETMSTRLNDPKTGARVIIMQRLHEDDLTGALLTLAKEGGTQYEHLCIPVEYNSMHPTPSTRFTDPRASAGSAADGMLLWPERYNREKIAQLKRELGAYGTSGQLQQMPSPATGGIFKREHWRYWQPEGMKLPDVPVGSTGSPTGRVYITPVDLPAHFDKQAQSWDCAFKASADNDNVAGQVWGCAGANKYLLDYSLDKMNITGTMDAIMGFTGRWPGAIEKLIEDTANGPAVIQLLTNRVAGLIPVSPEGGKLARAWSAQPEVESGNVYLPHPALYPWVNQFVDNCAMFPNAAHDDDVDAFTQLMIRWQTRQKQVIFG